MSVSVSIDVGVVECGLNETQTPWFRLVSIVTSTSVCLSVSLYAKDSAAAAAVDDDNDDGHDDIPDGCLVA